MCCKDGDDYLDSWTSDDILNGGNGYDQFQDDDGSDTFRGRAGVDSVSYYFGRSVTVNLATGIAIDAEGTNTLNSIENVFCFEASDTLIGNAEDNSLDGFDRADVLKDGGGNDYLFSGFADALEGDSGDDRLIGGQGKDTLAGGLGKDKLSGGRGNDNFRYDFLSYEGGIDGDLQIEVSDIITDLSPRFDTIQVDDVGFGDGLQEGAITQEQFQLGSRAQDTLDRFIYNRIVLLRYSLQPCLAILCLIGVTLSLSEFKHQRATIEFLHKPLIL